MFQFGKRTTPPNAEPRVSTAPPPAAQQAASPSPQPAPSAAPAIVTPAPAAAAAPKPNPPANPPVKPPATPSADLIRDQVLQRIEPAVAVHLSHAELAQRVSGLVSDIATEHMLLLNRHEQALLSTELVDDMIGLGPLETLLRDDTVSDILVTGAQMVYVERRGKLQLTPVKFRNNAHVLHVAQRIASSIGRRVDESSPMLDARLADGSRVNVIIPPLSLKGPSISIRKFSKSLIDFARFVQFGTMSAGMGRVLEIAARCRLNIIVSGGTGSGKTTLLNALSSRIEPTERIVTIEDAAELQLQQPHVVQLETRPSNLEGKGEISQRDLLRNALRMRPDRIIVGEVRGPEAFDMMQAMNTGHDGSMSTIHANSGRDALARIENMMLMASVSLPISSIRAQMSSALDIIVQTARMRDGVRRVTEIVEVAGMEGDVFALETIFAYKFIGQNADGTLRGTFQPSRIRPRFLARLEYFGLADAFMDAISDRERPPE